MSKLIEHFYYENPFRNKKKIFTIIWIIQNIVLQGTRTHNIAQKKARPYDNLSHKVSSRKKDISSRFFFNFMF